MAKTRRDLMTAAAVAATLFSGAKAFAAEAEPTTVVLHVSNYARLSPSDVNGAEEEATRIYKAADIKVVWVNPGAAESEAYAGALHLTVLLLNREMAQNKIDADQIPQNVLGQAGHATGRAYIFCHRISAVADTHGQDFATVLGRVLAHEAGHMVLPVHSHSDTGIMRATLDLSNAPQRFSLEQVAKIHETVAADLLAKR